VRRDLLGIGIEELWSVGQPLPEAKGRGGAAVLRLSNGITGVCRDFRRGGALRWLPQGSYLDPRRPDRELETLRHLHLAAVPVVLPLAALSRRSFLFFHRLRLVTELVEGARPLPAFVAAEPESRRQAVREAGRVVRLALDQGLCHPDLHPDNLLARHENGAVEVYLLDLDRARILPRLSQRQQDGMLLRMVRYLRRHEADLPFRPAPLDGLRFLCGMGLSRPERRAALARLAPRLRRALLRHGL
jgi:hypothetical protein